MNQEQVIKLFNEFLSKYDVEKHGRIWREHSQTFRDFWKRKILGHEEAPLSDADYDPIIRLLDINARGFRRETDEAVARVGLRQGIWYRIFNDLREKADIRATLDQIFDSSEEPDLTAMVDRLEQENKENRNGLTGKNANALNALLFLNRPEQYLSSVSLSHRFQIIEAFGFGNRETYSSYGEKVIQSNRDIIDGLRTKIGIDAATRTISEFLYFSPVSYFWKREFDEEGAEEEGATPSEAEFVIEKHLEDFLVGNWESTELGKLYDLIEENGEVASQQYRTDIGRIDLLVRDKKDGSYVVVELKKGQTSDDTVGQLTRYMGWVKEHKASGGKVRGIIIAATDDRRLQYALAVVPETELFFYKVNFALEKSKR